MRGLITATQLSLSELWNGLSVVQNQQSKQDIYYRQPLTYLPTLLESIINIEGSLSGLESDTLYIPLYIITNIYMTYIDLIVNVYQSRRNK